MKFRIYGMILSLFFVLGLVFSFGGGVSADQPGDDTGKKAEDVDATVKKDVEAFLDNIIDYYNQAVADKTGDALTRELAIYGRDIRQEGPYKSLSNEMYSMGLNENGFLTNHARYAKELFGYKFNSEASDSAVAGTIQALIDGSGVDMKHCVEDYDDQGRVACAEKVTTTSGEVTVIAGLHHAEDDTAFAPPDCAGFELDTSAEDVSETPDKLEEYVKNIIMVAQRQVSSVTVDVSRKNLGLAQSAAQGDMAAQQQLAQKILQEIYGKTACFGSGDFAHENIYAFIMSADLANSTVLVNGNNFDLNGANLDLNDDQLSGEQNIARLFNTALSENSESGEIAAGSSATVTYHWDDPTNEDDDVENFLRERKVPGTSCKRSYIEVANINETVPGIPPGTPPALYIFGSGTYHEPNVCASGDGEMPTGTVDDDGCAIAGAGHTSQSALLNLFLVASVLFSVVFLRRRA